MRLDGSRPDEKLLQRAGKLQRPKPPLQTKSPDIYTEVIVKTFPSNMQQLTHSAAPPRGGILEWILRGLSQLNRSLKVFSWRCLYLHALASAAVTTTAADPAAPNTSSVTSLSHSCSLPAGFGSSSEFVCLSNKRKFNSCNSRRHKSGGEVKRMEK